ncbi:MAG: hypothetical protein QOG48_448 [Verrucomicrobiota bacterium]
MRRCLCLLIALSASAFGKDVKQTREDGAQFVGAVGCRSSSCHGGAGEKRSQYITWSQKDFHTKAFAILLNARSKQIAEGAGLTSAESSARCTVCHSPFASVTQSRLGPNVRIDEGVSCETCHGAASPWLRGHTRSDWAYATRVSAGMHDLRNIYVRANACAACHQNIDNDILKAGHPALVFELDSQSSNEPKHWRDDDPKAGPRSWLVGQAVALREAAWHARTDADASTDAQQTSIALAWLLAKVTLSDASLPKINEPVSSDLEPLQKQADELARRAANWTATNESMMSILRAIAESDSEFAKEKTESNFYRAVRVTLALERLTVALDIKIDNELKALRADAQRHYDFDAAAFAQHLRALREKL